MSLPNMLTHHINLFVSRLHKKIIRRGSLYLRKLFSHKRLKAFLGSNLALMLIASSFIPTSAFGEGVQEDNIVVENKINLTTKVSIQYPVASVKITQGYRTFHPGLDLDGITGDEIRPIKDGIVELISTSKYAYGKAILINHGEGVTSLYAHLSKILVEEGQAVETSTVIGQMGATGHAQGDHLHLEVRKNGIPVNPYTILPR